MRISTNQIYQTGARNLMEGQSRLYNLQNQLSTGKKFLSAQDDPVAAALVLLNSQSLSVNTQHAENQANANAQLALEEDRLTSIVNNVLYIMEQTVAGQNASYSDSQRQFYADDLQQQFEFLLGMANGTDANGYYLFSGYQGNTKPFQLMSDGSVNYAGDDGQRLLQVGTSRQIAVSDSGRDIFERIRTGNGTFALGADLANNTGTGVIGIGSVNDIVAWRGLDSHKFEIEFDTPPTTYTITDTTAGTTLGSYAYTPGTDITNNPDIPGISFSIGGTPNAGDKFTVEPSTDQSIFNSLQNLITAFSTPIENDGVAAAKVKNIINAEMVNFDQVLNNVASVQASIGSRRAELNSLLDISSALDLHYQERLSNLQEADYVEVISKFMQQQTQLQASQSSFSNITSLSLFSYL
ncbi:MAG: flagellar hook-associated protein FlgL [Candidatus Accumulibacter sp.]|jgi:flagellar hook-associated protein 3 FlgL|nr:flagellar hook-associated protein FlgL [Accumulibacter sp.]